MKTNTNKKLKKQNEILKFYLLDMICQADQDTPSEYRTRHFRNTMTTAYDYLKEIGYIEKDN